MGFVRKIKQRGKTYYAEVENQWINGKCVQKHVRSLGPDPKHPKNIPIEPVHFSYLALRLMQDELTPNDLFEMLEKMGQPVKKEGLERIGITYDFEKKTYSISLFYRKISESRPHKQRDTFNNPENLSEKKNFRYKSGNSDRFSQMAIQLST